MVELGLINAQANLSKGKKIPSAARLSLVFTAGYENIG